MKTHSLNVSYLVVGLVCLGVAGSWALHQGGILDFTEEQWLLPLTLVAAGVVGLVAFAAKGMRRSPQSDDTAGTDDTRTDDLFHPEHDDTRGDPR